MARTTQNKPYAVAHVAAFYKWRAEHSRLAHDLYFSIKNQDCYWRAATGWYM